MMNAMIASTRATTRGSIAALKSLSFSVSMGVLRSSPLFAWMCSCVSNAIRNESDPMSTTYKLNNTKSIKNKSNVFFLKTLPSQMDAEDCVE